MPVKGVILILTVAVIVAFFERDAIYGWLGSAMHDDSIDQDDEFKEENN